MDIGQLTIVVICGLLGAWYVGASIYNRRRGLALARWIQAGLRSLGGKTEYKWLGSVGSGLRASAHGLEKPLKQLDAALLLETRELLPLWLLQWATGRRDQLILKIALRRGINAQVDAAPRVFPPEGWSYVQVTPSLQLTAADSAAKQFTEAFRPFFTQYSHALRSFSYRPEEPQIVMTLILTGVEARPAEEIFSVLTRCVESLGPGG